MRRIVAVALAAAAAACSRDTSLPPPPGAGSIQGRVVYAVPGQSARVAAAGARVTVLGTSIGATAGSDGRFVIGEAALSDGDLLVQADLDGNGTPDRQTLLSLAALGARPGRDLALGDVVVVENARVRGRVLRADVPGASGHAGTVVFVAQGPFTTLTGDDGSYVFENLPEGRISLTFFRDGYDPQAIDGVQLRAGEDFAAREVSLARAPPSAGGALPGAVAGQLTFSPPASGAGARVTAAQVSPDPTAVVSALASPSGSFQLPAVPPGLYRLEAARAGYVTAIVSNVMVGAGSETRLAISLAAQGLSAPAPDPVVVPSCVSGVRCDLPNGCQVGQVSCATGSPVCAPIGNALDGLSCGVNQVCSGGTCVTVCVSGASCRPQGDPCREGVVSCATGLAACVAGTAALADGASCGANQVCHAGTCTPCFAGQSCTPVNPCDSGLTECSTGAQTCRDTGLAVADGTGCGASLFCAAGVCGACQPGKACTPAGFPCHSGTTSCATGREVCVDGALVQDGTTCGTNRVCRTGACNDCTEGAGCVPAALPCQRGLVACGSGLPVCVAQAAPADPGLACGAGHVCDGAGTCVACVPGQACTPQNPCHAGGIACASGAPVCGDLGVPLADGTGCGADRVCSAGTCVGCVADGACTPANPCHRGTTSCRTGQPVCGDTNVPLADGATCGTDQVCRTGACVACATGAACDGAAGHAPAPAVSDPCKVFVTACASGTPTCDGGQDRPDGTSCGPSLICRSGSCQTSPMIIELAGDLQHALPNQPLPQLLAVTIRNVLTAQGVAGQTVSVTAPAGAQVNRTSATTDPTGLVTFALTLGRAAGPQDFVVRHDPSYPTTVAARQLADPPADGTVIPLVNAARLGSGPALGTGPAVNASTPAGIAVAASGDLYFTSQCEVRKLSAAGVVTKIAGTVCAGGAGGDGGPALSATFWGPTGLALDEVNQRLYVGEVYNNRVRMIDLRTGFVWASVGTGATGTIAPYGDGGPANLAQLGSPSGLTLGPGPNPALYVVDTNHDRVRRVDPVTGVISTVIAGNTATACSADPAALYDISCGAGAVALDAAGRVFVSGRICGTATGGAAVQGILRIDLDGSVHHVGGAAGGLGPGPARGAGFGCVSGMAFDDARTTTGSPRQNLYLADSSRHVVARIDGVTSRVSFAGGDLTASSTGDFGPGPAATFNAPVALAFVPGTRDLVVAERTGNAIRALAGAGTAAATQAALAGAGGDGQSGYVDQALPTPLAVTLTEGAGTPVSGFPVRFALDPAGSSGATVASALATTSIVGTAATTARLGLRPGVVRVVASFDDLHGDPVAGSPVVFTATAAAPPAGTVFTVVNEQHTFVSGGAPTSALGVVAGIGAPSGAALLPDGSLAFAEGTNYVLRLAPNGTLSRIAGCPGCPTSDGLPADATSMGNVRDVALSPDGSTLFVNDGQNARVRAVNLATGISTTFAGTGANTCPGTGDGGPATSAALCYPGALSTDGRGLYVSTYFNGTESFRRIGIDPAAPDYGTISTFLARGASAVGQTVGLATTPSPTAPPTAWGCDADRCAVAVDPSGRLYVSGHFAGLGFGGTTGTYPGIVRIEGDGTLTRVAGRWGASVPSAGLPLDRAGFGNVPTIAFDRSGNLWVANVTATANQNVVGWVAPDPVTGRIEATGVFNQLGQATSTALPAAGSYLPVASSYLGAVYAITFTPEGHVLLTDSLGGSYSVRMIW